MALTEEEKQKIEEEERFRAEARRKAEGAATQPTADKKGRFGCGGCLIVVIALFAGLLIIGKLSAPSEEERAKSAAERENSQCQGDKVMAWVIAKKLIKPQLKSPSTAVFEDSHTDKMVFPTGIDCQYRVRAYVDAQNAFGAKLRNKFTAVVKYNGNDKWSLVSLEFD